MSDVPLKWCFSLLLSALTAGAAEAAQSTNVAVLTQPLPDVGTSLLRLAGAMVVVLGIFFGGIWCFRNWQRLTAGRRPSSKLQILEVKTLGNRQALYLVACEGQTLLLGSSPGGLTPLGNFLTPVSASPGSRSNEDDEAFDENLQTMIARQP